MKIFKEFTYPFTPKIKKVRSERKIQINIKFKKN